MPKLRPYRRRRDALHRRVSKVFLWLAHELAFNRLPLETLYRRLTLRLTKIGCLPMKRSVFYAEAASVREYPQSPKLIFCGLWGGATLIEPTNVRIISLHKRDPDLRDYVRRIGLWWA